jgi:hypothetical protein
MEATAPSPSFSARRALIDAAACAADVPALAAAALAELFAPVPFSAGKEISLRGREALGVPEERIAEAPALVYGETSATALARVLAVVERRRRERRREGDGAGASAAGDRDADADALLRDEQRREVFLDVGSGIGKPVFAAALLRPWARCVGVELLEGLHAEALALRETWRGGLPFSQRGVKQALFRIPPEARAARLDLRCADACDAARLPLGNAEDEEDAGLDDAAFSQPLWSAVDVAFACSTCFDEATLARVAQAAEAMRPGALFAACSAPMPAAWGALVAELPDCPVSWGTTTVYVSERGAPGAGADNVGGGSGGGGEGADAGAAAAQDEL